ncbi:MAG: hypothetical protein P8M34_05350 [Saprospiraceae bacterium]|nr:hypothetical protein [Saprospiraceae bacterium]
MEAYDSTPNLEEYYGEYHSVEVVVSYTINAVDKQFVVYRNKQNLNTLFPVCIDVFGNQVLGY